jgi:hypothetical protein
VSGGWDIGFGHEAHPLLGKRVVDTGTGRIGILRAVALKELTRGGVRVSMRRAWLVPVRGGVEWTVAPEAVREAPQ